MALICWSGGCDSTLLLVNMLYERQNGGSHDIRTLSVDNDQLSSSPQQKAARDAIECHLNKLGMKWNRIEATFGGNGVQPAEGGVILPVMWLSLASMFLRPDEDLYLGYVRCDDFWHHKQQAEYAWQYLQAMQGRKGELQWPLEFMYKHEVISALKAHGVLKRCWYCELPREDKACGDCQSCVTHARGMREYEYENKRKAARPSLGKASGCRHPLRRRRRGS